MRTLILCFGFILGVVGLSSAYMFGGREHQKTLDVQRLEKEILTVEQKISLLRKLTQRPAISLDAAYIALINDMHIIARAHRIVFTIFLQGGGGLDVDKDAHESDFSALREVDLHGVFSGLDRRSTLLSLLDALSVFQQGAPVIFRRMEHEKDVLVFDITVLGL